MADTGNQTNELDADSTDQKTPKQTADYWLEQIEFAGKKRKKFVTRGKQIIKRYRNRRTDTNVGVGPEGRRMNILWSNVQTLKPTLFSQAPKPNVSRRNKSNVDPVGRVAAQVLENVLQNSIGAEDYTFVMNQVVDDRLLPGIGLCMVEYQPTVEEDEIGWQAAETVYIHWEDWLTNVARVWQEVTWFAYRTFHTRQQVYDIVLKATGDAEYAAEVKAGVALDHTEERNTDNGRSDGKSKATVWCVWDKDTKLIYLIAPGFEGGPLGQFEAPVNFNGFFPIPRPLQATTTQDTTYPVADYDQYEDQAQEIDMLTQRIGLLTKSLRMRGVYAADMESIKQIMESATDQDLIPIENAMMLMEKGGLEKAIMWMPIDMMARCLDWCYTAREKALEVVYQITGISDIQRGDTDPGETMGAQQLKAQFGGIRVRSSQNEVARFNRDLLRLKSEVICEHFTQPIIQSMSGVQILTEAQKQQIATAQQLQQQRMEQWQLAAQQAQSQGLPAPPQPPPMPPIPKPVQEAMKEPTWEQVMGLLQNEKLRGFVVDVETDSTIEADQQAQQAAAVQFMTAVTQYMEACAQILMATPQAAPLLGEMLQFGTRAFKVADTLEPAIDDFVEQIQAQAAAPKPPDPKQQAEQIKGQVAIGTAKIGQQTAQIKGQAEQAKAQAELIQTATDHHASMEQTAADLALARASPPTAGAPV